MTGEWLIPVVLWIFLCVGAVLAIWECIELRKVLRQRYAQLTERTLFAESHLGVKAAALHGHLDLHGLHRYYKSISDQRRLVKFLALIPKYLRIKRESIPRRRVG